MPPKPITSSILYVGSLPFDWDEDTVKSVVCGSGNIVDVRLGFDYEGKNKGFCFVEYQTPRDAQRAAPLLSSIVIFQPNGTQKRLKIEGSKEGPRTNKAESKKVLNINRTKLPPNVRLPPELSSGGGGGGGGGRYNSPLPPTQMQQQQRMMTPPTFGTPQSMGGGGGGGGVGPNQQMPVRLTQASKNLPHVASLPLEVPDKINEALSKIPPPQLIELIANMKNMLITDPGRVQALLQANTTLAHTTAQVLLMMGFIDSDVIKESAAAAAATSTTPTTSTIAMAQPPYGQQQPMVYNNMSYGQKQQQPPPLQQQQQQQQQQHALHNSKWPHLPIDVQMKLAALPEGEANNCATILSISKAQYDLLTDMNKVQVQQIRERFGQTRL
ncbi:hypothetical protein KGF56_000211 [Candida oxycetoniae]|uniref:RRM domain-containing protein n=1 Tax=Candida oxycetoniae TaxID=497107 RepID=A0AAI9T1J5_9ASCO|nr:uncharacterized protein KGF56_000211 [Candida oxycetoniae]KAI3406919.2 hypothetical protein KGF56_000211 [Candida oxycetoniae]